jgi:hypothetical protein
MKMRCLRTVLFLIASAPLVGCVMFDGADDFPQPCYGPDCVGGGLAQYGNVQYGHSGGHIGEPVFTPAAPVIPGGAPLPPGVTEVQLTPDEPSTKTKDDSDDETPAPAPPNGVQSIDIPSPPAPTPTP